MPRFVLAVVPAAAGLQIDLELDTNDGSVTAADATTAMKAVLADLAAVLAGV